MTITAFSLSDVCYFAAKSLQSCPTLCNPIDGSPPGSPVPGILKARTLEWVAISFSNAWKWKVKVKSLSRARLFATPWTAAFQAPPSMGFPGKSTGVGCHCLLRCVTLKIDELPKAKEEGKGKNLEAIKVVHSVYIFHLSQSWPSACKGLPSCVHLLNLVSKMP